MIHNTQQITIPEGCYAEINGNTVEIKPIKPKYPETWGELNIIEGWWIDKDSYINYISLVETQEEYKNVFHTKKQAKAVLAFAQLSQLYAKYREIEGGGDVRYSIMFFHTEDSYKVNQIYHNRMFSFSKKETAELFLKNFENLFDDLKFLYLAPDFHD